MIVYIILDENYQIDKVFSNKDAAVRYVLDNVFGYPLTPGKDESSYGFVEEVIQSHIVESEY